MAVYLAPAEFIDSDHASIVALAAELCAHTTGVPAATQAIYRFVRDLTYEGDDFEDPEIFRASSVLAAGHGSASAKHPWASPWPGGQHPGTHQLRRCSYPPGIALAAPRLGTDTFA